MHLSAAVASAYQRLTPQLGDAAIAFAREQCHDVGKPGAGIMPSNSIRGR